MVDRKSFQLQNGNSTDTNIGYAFSSAINKILHILLVYVSPQKIILPILLYRLKQWKLIVE